MWIEDYSRFSLSNSEILPKNNNTDSHQLLLIQWKKIILREIKRRSRSESSEWKNVSIIYTYSILTFVAESNNTLKWVYYFTVNNGMKIHPFFILRPPSNYISFLSNISSFKKILRRYLSCLDSNINTNTHEKKRIYNWQSFKKKILFVYLGQTRPFSFLIEVQKKFSPMSF